MILRAADDPLAVRMSKAIAGVCVTHREHEEGEPEGNHQEIKHGRILQIARTTSCRVGREADHKCASRSVVLKCHPLHRFSRREELRPYKNLIRTSGIALKGSGQLDRSLRI